MSNLRRNLDHACDLLNWFWRFGCHRTNPPLGDAWITQLYDTKELLEIAVQIENRQRAGVAIWGPSQAGKSTLLSAYMDDQTGADSALTWSAEVPFRFDSDVRGDQTFARIPAFNPYSGGGDASACVTCFTLQDSVQYPNYPVIISLGTRQGLLQAIASGYLTECRLENHDGLVTFWSQETARDLLGDPGKNYLLNQEALELARDLSTTIERMIAERAPRYINLAQSWNTELRRALMRAATDLNSIEEITKKLLWDARPGLNRLFADLESARVHYKGLFGYRTIYCSLEFAKLLVDIKTYSAFAEDENENERRNAEDENQNYPRSSIPLHEKLTSFRYERHDDRVIIGQVGEPLFPDDPYSFGLFQGLVWSITLPLKRSFVRQRATILAKLLEKADLYDVPGVANEGEARSEQLLSADENGASRPQLLAYVVKRGKTSTILTQFARQRLIDNLLLLVRAERFPAHPAQLVAGAEAIWTALDPDRSPEAPPTAPTILCLTFMAEFLNTVNQTGVTEEILRAFGRKLDRLGPLRDPSLVPTFLTSYPKFDSGQIRADKEKLLQEIQVTRWFAHQFVGVESRASLEHMLQDDDGGVRYLLSVMADKVGEPASHRLLESARISGAEAIDQLIAQALPLKNDLMEATEKALEEIVLQIEDYLENPPPNIDPSATLSQMLRDVLEVDPLQLEPIPRIRTSEAAVSAYIDRQKATWLTGALHRLASANTNLAPMEQRLILDAFVDAVDTRQLAKWLYELLPAQPSRRMADHYRTYVAVAISNSMLTVTHEARVESNGYTRGDTPLSRCQELFDRWASGYGVKDSPHYEAIVDPLITRLQDLAQGLKQKNWQSQPGDSEVESIHEKRVAAAEQEVQGK